MAVHTAYSSTTASLVEDSGVEKELTPSAFAGYSAVLSAAVDQPAKV